MAYCSEFNILQYGVKKQLAYYELHVTSSSQLSFSRLVVAFIITQKVTLAKYKNKQAHASFLNICMTALEQFLTEFSRLNFHILYIKPSVFGPWIDHQHRDKLFWGGGGGLFSSRQTYGQSLNHLHKQVLERMCIIFAVFLLDVIFIYS